MSAASPTPSNMPPPNNKRPRPSGNGLTHPAITSGPNASPAYVTGTRNKRKRPDGTPVDDPEKKAKNTVEKGKEDEIVDTSEVKTKIDFNELPVETLYKYLEYHDLLPRWDVSPWSEEPCTPPNQLYTLSSTAPIVPPPSTTASQIPQTQEQLSTNNVGSVPAASTTNDITMSDSVNAAVNANGTANTNTNDPASSSRTAELAYGAQSEPQLPQLPLSPSTRPSNSNATNKPEDGSSTKLDAQDPTNPVDPTTNNENAEKAGGNEEDEETNNEDNFEPPTTRSKTLPNRKQSTPTPEQPPTPQPQIKRGVITLSDVYLAREVLAEKANNHWMKGLGGGQNKEGETIVNFLYKMKVGHGRLLRVYDPTTNISSDGSR